MAPTYRCEDLLKVRDRMRSSDEIVRKMNKSETAVQDHVLRTSSSNFSAPVRSKTHSSSIETSSYEAYERIPPDDFVYHGQRLKGSARRSKDSPSASIKRGKAEKLLKEHGSPPGVRVTAGGRIVPQGLQQLSSPQQIPVALRQHAGLFPGTQSSHQCVAHGVGIYDQFPHWQSPHLGAPYLSQLGTMAETTVPHGNVHGCTLEEPSSLAYSANYQHPSETWKLSEGLNRGQAEAQLSAATEEFHTVEKELRGLDRGEVMNKANLTRAQEESNTRRRILLTNRLDMIRRTILGHRKVLTQVIENCQPSHNVAKLETDAKHPNIDSQQPMSQGLSSVPTPHGYYFPAVVPLFHQMLPQYQFGFSQGVSPSSTEVQHNMASFAPLVPNPVYPDITPLSYATKPAPSVMHVAEAGCNNNSQEHEKVFKTTHLRQKLSAELLQDQSGDERDNAPRRSHALEIKRPRDTVAETSSSLDPESPAYKPVKVASNRAEAHEEQGITNATETDPDVAMSLPHNRDAKPKPSSSQANSAIQSDRSGASSVSTTDFFPNDPGSYSLKKYWVNKNRASAPLPGWISLPDASNSIDGSTGVSISVDNNAAFIGHNAEEPSAGLECNIGKTIVREISGNLIGHYDSLQDSSANASSLHRVEDSGIDNEIAVLAGEKSDPSPDLTIEGTRVMLSSHAVERDSTKRKYLHGYKCGLSQEILGAEAHDSEFYKGYRDGLLDSAQATVNAGYKVVSKMQTPCDDTSKRGIDRTFPTVSRTSSLPSFDIPAAPFNSTSNTPVKSESMNCGMVNPADLAIDQKFSPGFIGDQRTTPKRSHPTETIISIALPSPLSARKSSSQNQGIKTSPLHNKHATSFDTQRSPSKARPSTEASFNHAQTHIQLDGDVENEEQVLLGSAAFHSPCTSPGRPAKVTSSPSRSFALPSFTQFAFRSKKDAKADPRSNESNGSKNCVSPTKRRLSLGFGSPKKRKNTGH